MKRFGEKFKQSLGLGGNKEWKPTSNARNEAMLKDVRKFAQQLKAFHTQVKDLSTAIEGGMGTFKTVLLSPLPRAHDETPAGVTPIDRDEHPVGLSAMPEGLAAATAEMSSSLQTRVISPLDEWLTEYRKTKKLNEKCEEIRLDLDNKRRSTMQLQEKLAKLQAVNHKDTEATKLKVLTETDKLNRLAERYAECEAEVFNAFLRLIRDSAVLRDIMAESVAIMQRALTGAFASFNVGAPTSLPQIPAPVSVPLLTYNPVDVSSVGSVRMSADQAAALTGAAGALPMPMKSALSSRPATYSSGGDHNDSAAAGGVVGTSSAGGGGLAAPGASFGRAPSPNSDAPRGYPHVGSPQASAGNGSSSGAAPPPPAWQPVPSVSPVKPAYDSDADDNPFSKPAAAAAPAPHPGAYGALPPVYEPVGAPATGHSSGDPSNPFKAGRSQQPSDDGTQRHPLPA